jgi:hypothetical protein
MNAIEIPFIPVSFWQFLYRNNQSARRAEERSDDEVAKPPSSPVGAALGYPLGDTILRCTKRPPNQLPVLDMTAR